MKKAHIRLETLENLGKGTVVGFPASVEEYLLAIADRFGEGRDPLARLWLVPDDTTIGTIVELK